MLKMPDVKKFIKDIKLSIQQEETPLDEYNMDLQMNYGQINHIIENDFLIIVFDNNDRTFDKKYRDILNTYASSSFINATSVTCFNPRVGLENIINIIGLIETLDKNSDYTYNDKNYYFVSMMQVQNINNNTCILWNICTRGKYRNTGCFSKIFQYFISTKCINDKIYLYVKQEQSELENLFLMYTHLGFKISGWDRDKFLFECKK